MRRPGARRTPPRPRKRAKPKAEASAEPAAAFCRCALVSLTHPRTVRPPPVHRSLIHSHDSSWCWSQLAHGFALSLSFTSDEPAQQRSSPLLLSVALRWSAWRRHRSECTVCSRGARAPQGSHPSDSSSRSPTAHAIPCKQSASGPQHGRHNGQSSTMRAAHCTPHLVGRDNHSPCRRPPCPRRGNASGRGMR